jgi:hypothetical protein
MSGVLTEAAPRRLERLRIDTRLLDRRIVATAYGLVGGALVLSRLTFLGKSYWFDEVVTVEDVVRGGPRVILAGQSVNHELYSLLAWTWASAFGEGEIGLRLLSAIPFLLGTALVTAYLHRRVHAAAGVFFLFFATVSPLLLDITRQARGYGIAFFAASLLFVGALEASRSGRASAVAALAIGGILGTWTLPQFAVTLFITLAVLLLDRRLRRTAAVWIVVAEVAVLGWYMPHSSTIHGALGVELGEPIRSTWLLTAPIDQVLLPALIWLEGGTLRPGVAWIPFVALAAAVIGSSPLIRRRDSALILCGGPGVTIVVLWLQGAFLYPRFLSFLLVPLFILTATGSAEILRQSLRRRALLRATCLAFAVAGLSINFAMKSWEVLHVPREANRDAAQILDTLPLDVPVLGSVLLPRSIEFYSARTIRVLEPSEIVPRVCGATAPVAYVRQPQGITLVDVPCLRRVGVEHHHLVQYAWGKQIDIWVVPPADS